MAKTILHHLQYIPIVFMDQIDYLFDDNDNGNRANGIVYTMKNNTNATEIK